MGVNLAPAHLHPPRQTAPQRDPVLHFAHLHPDPFLQELIQHFGSTQHFGC